MARFTACAFVLVVLSCVAVGQGPVQLHNGGLWSNWTTVPSVIWTSPPANEEAADDFDVVGTITRVVANGSGCWQCAPPTLAGVWVRFYAWQSGNPGALQYQAFVPAGSPGLLYNPTLIDVIDVTLPAPFAATGQHFVSIQASFVGGAYWSLWICDLNAPTNASLRFRNNLTTGTWGSYSSISVPALSADLDLELWGYPSTPPAQPTDPCGQWDVVSPAAPPGNYHTLLRDLKVMGAVDVWAVGASTIGTIGNLSTLNAAWHWDGDDWTQTPIPNPGGTGSPNNGLYAIDGSSSNDVYAAGYQSIQVAGGWFGPQLEVLHWDGSQWTLLPNTPLPPTSIGAGVSGASINDVDVLGPDDVWFAGFWLDLQASGVVTQPGLLMHYDGSNFALTQVPIVVSASTQGQTFTKIEAITPTDVWAVGFKHGYSTPAVPFGEPLAFHWDGSSWSPYSIPVPGTPSIIADLDALGPNDVWFLGYHTPTVGTATPFLFYWNGVSFTQLPAPPSGGSLEVFAANDIYAGGQGVWHFDGASWTAVQSFPSLTSAGFATIDGPAPCQLWGGGGQWVVGQAVPFVARQPWLYARAQQRIGCLGGSTPGTLEALTLPRLGTLFGVGLSDPTQALGLTGGGLAFWAVSAAPLSGPAGCGVPIPGAGAGGGPGELLIDLGPIVLTFGPSPWGGGAAVANYSVALPFVASLAGVQVYTQGALFDAANLAHFVVTPALDIRVGY